MLEVEEPVQIFDNLNNEYVSAKIVPISLRHIRQIELNWKTQLIQENCWDESLDINKYLNDEKSYEVYALEYDSIAQGIIVLKVAKYPSRLEAGKNLLYLTLVSVAPGNRMSTLGKRNYKGVGTVLLTFAILHSFRLGFEGRIALHSIKSAEFFFIKMPFIDGGYDSFYGENNGRYSNFKYLEMPGEQAELVMLDFYLTSYLKFQTKQKNLNIVLS